MKLDIEQETSSLSAGVAGAADLITNTRTITTHVFVNDGEILVLGGLVGDELRETDRAYRAWAHTGPRLAVPLAQNRSQKTNLMVFIRPTILRDAADARFQTNAKYRYIQTCSVRWPTVPCA